ncbi:hypothetical protein MLD38_040036 [Melastoma candidum]|uniref:Uncharacterized protein n=1 Tax=Melastoma candidum TaxID=119954 RepID=A0ACB9L403_9MYRT|nr:hypothetical protein MLD38_040036 [Melastoma candidum]
MSAIPKPSLHFHAKPRPRHCVVLNPNRIKIPRKRYNVFIVHRGVDTKEKEASLVYDYLLGSGYLPFLDVESLNPGEKIPDRVDEALCESMLGIGVFSPRFGESRSCLYEIVRLKEMGKPILPIFCNIEPFELRVAEYLVERDTEEMVKQYTDALEEAKQILGLRFNTATGNWCKLGRDTVKAVDRIFLELGKEYHPPSHDNGTGYNPTCASPSGPGGTFLGNGLNVQEDYQNSRRCLPEKISTDMRRKKKRLIAIKCCRFVDLPLNGLL